ncbi:MAG: hypothetical protein NTW10_09830 [Bacteroidetes bacterium]|nr:hypothetical protein [Bacteroidota bacterium]
MLKFYPYIIYKVYTWGNKGSYATPVLNVLIALTFVHYVQLLILQMILARIFPSLRFLGKPDRLYLAVGLILFFVLHYFIFYNKNRWASYVERYKDETGKKKRVGSILVLSYLIGSILLFFLLLPVLF